MALPLSKLYPFQDNVLDVLAIHQLQPAVYGAGIQVSALPASLPGTATATAATTLTDSAATFVTDDVEAGDLVYNADDGSIAVVKSVDSETQLTTTPLFGGSDNTWTSGDDYTVRTAPGQVVTLTADWWDANGAKFRGTYIRSSDNMAWIQQNSDIFVPDGFLVNGTILAYVETGLGLVLSLTTQTGTNPGSPTIPSPNDPAYAGMPGLGYQTRRIQGTVGLLIADGSNACNMGSAELAGHDVEVFVYLIYRSASSTFDIGISRIPGGKYCSDFNLVDGTNEKVLYSNGGYTGTDRVMNIGRITVNVSSVGSGSAFSTPSGGMNIINEPIDYTSWLSYTPTINSDQTLGSITRSSRYQIRSGRVVETRNIFSFTPALAATVVRTSTPFSGDGASYGFLAVGDLYNGTTHLPVHAYHDASTPKLIYFTTMPTATGFAAAGSAIYCMVSQPF